MSRGFRRSLLDALVRHDPRAVPHRCGCPLHGERPAARRSATACGAASRPRASIGSPWRTRRRSRSRSSARSRSTMPIRCSARRRWSRCGSRSRAARSPRSSSSSRAASMRRSASRRSAGRIRCSRSPCPHAERMSRADLIATANKYFTGMQQNDGKGEYPFAADCNRIENGMQTTNRPTPAGEARPDPATAANYSAQWSCREQFESGLAALRHAHPRPPLRRRRSASAAWCSRSCSSITRPARRALSRRRAAAK